MADTAHTIVTAVPATDGDLTVMTPRKKWFRVGMRACVLLTGDTRYRRGPISAVTSQNSAVIIVDGAEHVSTRVLGKNRFQEA
jgi:hypothetical protein